MLSIPLSFKRRAAGALLALLIFAFARVPAWAASAQLTVQGNQVIANGGCTVRLKGVDVDSLEYESDGFGSNPSGGGITASAAEAVTAWNANIIRLPLNQDYWFGCGGGGTNGAAYQAMVDEIVNFCNANNAYVILDLHWSGATTIGATAPCGSPWGNANSLNNGHQLYMPDDNSVTFWSSVATRYANNPAVLFDLFNEPYDYQGNGWTVWFNGGTDTAVTPSFHTPGMKALMTAVRATGANNVLVIGGLDYAYDLSGVTSNSCGGPCSLVDSGGGNGVIYASHIYPYKGSNPWVPSDGNAKILTATQYFPVIISEFGENGSITGYTPNPDTNGAWDQTLLNWINGSNISSYKFHATAWDFHTSSSPDLLVNWQYTPTTYHGVPVYNWLATPVAACVAATPTDTPGPCMAGGFTCTPSFTPTLTPTITITPTPTVTLTPTVTSTPNPGSLMPFPNPSDGQSPVSFYYNVTGPTTGIDLKVFTVANRLIFKDAGLDTSLGQHIYGLNWAQRNLHPANGLYYFLVTFHDNGQQTRQIMKELVIR